MKILHKEIVILILLLLVCSVLHIVRFGQVCASSTFFDRKSVRYTIKHKQIPIENNDESQKKSPYSVSITVHILDQ